MPIRTVKELEVVYNDVIIAAQGVSLTVPEHSIIAVLGSNVAGKTTTLRAISGFLGVDNARISNGSIEFDGERLNDKPPHEVVGKGIVLVPERNKIFTTLTIEENLSVPALSKNSGKTTNIPDVFDYFPVLKERRRVVAGYISGGEMQMLAIGTALLSSPKLLLVDELSLGLAPQVIDTITAVLKKIRDDLGISILLVEQNAAAALAIADYAYIMENGRIVFEGNPEKLLAHEDVREFYLGVSDEYSKSYRDVKQYRRTRRWWG